MSGKMLRLVCSDEDGAVVATHALSSFRGEATVSSRRGTKLRVHSFDLSFAVQWTARLSDDCEYSGSLDFSEVASFNQPDEYELSVAFDSRPADGSAAEASLVGLIGPLRYAAARQAEGRLTQKLWEHLSTFAADFAELP